jgi:hypothetical protein
MLTQVYIHTNSRQSSHRLRNPRQQIIIRTQILQIRKFSIILSAVACRRLTNIRTHALCTACPRQAHLTTHFVSRRLLSSVRAPSTAFPVLILLLVCLSFDTVCLSVCRSASRQRRQTVGAQKQPLERRYRQDFVVNCVELERSQIECGGFLAAIEAPEEVECRAHAALFACMCM